MKKLFSVFCALALVSVVAFAQTQNKKGNKKGDDQWREKVRSEQVAFITSELNLTEAEAQAFWPVYNDIQNQRRDAYMAIGQAFKSLQEGIEGNEVNKLLDQYLDTKKAAEKIDDEAIARFKKVLPIEKVAKLMLAEEKFRHQQIGKLGQGGRPGMPPKGNKNFGGQRPGFPQSSGAETSL